MTYPSRRNKCWASRPAWPPLGLHESISLLRTWRLQLRIVQCRTVRGRDLQRLSRQRVSEGGERQDIVGQRPAIRIRKRVPVRWHRGSVQARGDGPEEVAHRRAGFEL